MAKKKRITRKQLLKEPDEFLTFSAKALQFTLDHRTHVAYGFGILVGAILLMSAIGYFINTAENKAFEALNRSMADYTEALAKDGAVEAAAEVEGDFQTIVEKYGGRKATRFARLMYADICFAAGRIDQSLELYRIVLRDFGMMQPYRNLILNSIGMAYEEKEDYERAAEYYEKIIESDGDLMKSDALYALGRLYDLLGNKDKSITAYSRLVEDYPGAMHIAIAQDKTAG